MISSVEKIELVALLFVLLFFFVVVFLFFVLVCYIGTTRHSRLLFILMSLVGYIL